MAANSWYVSSGKLGRATPKKEFVHAVNVNRTTRGIGWFSSLMTNSTHPYHSSLEYWWLRYLDMSPQFITFKAQPKSFGFLEDGIPRHYCPDTGATTISQEEVFFEVKPVEFVRQSKFASKWPLMVQAVKEAGSRLILITDEFLHQEPRHSTIRRLQARRSVPPDLQITYLIDKAFLDADAIAFGDLIKVWDDRLLVQHTIESLILRRRLVIDLMRPLDETAMISQATTLYPANLSRAA